MNTAPGPYPIGIVPKPHQPDKWRMITDLSCPRSSSVNNGISLHLCSLCYSSVDDAVAIVRQIGRETLLIELDIKDAYRIVPVQLPITGYQLVQSGVH